MPVPPDLVGAGAAEPERPRSASRRTARAGRGCRPSSSPRSTRPSSSGMHRGVLFAAAARLLGAIVVFRWLPARGTEVDPVPASPRTRTAFAEETVTRRTRSKPDDRAAASIECDRVTPPAAREVVRPARLRRDERRRRRRGPVSKATIYRRVESKLELVTAAMYQVAEERKPTPDTGSSLGDVHATARRSASSSRRTSARLQRAMMVADGLRNSRAQRRCTRSSSSTAVRAPQYGSSARSPRWIRGDVGTSSRRRRPGGPALLTGTSSATCDRRLR